VIAHRSVTIGAVLAGTCLLSGFCAGAAHAAGATHAAGRFVEVNHHQIYYEIHGTGMPLVLLHGGGDSFEYSFGKVLPALSAHHQVIAIEQTGHGHSPDAPGKLSYAGMTEDTSELLRILDRGPTDVVGWSDGGVIALMLAARHAAQVRRVVASGANFSPDGIVPAALAELKQSSAAAVYNAAERAEALRLNPGGEAQMLSVGAKLKQLWLSSPTAVELSPAILSAIAQPVMIMAGDRDEIRIEHTLVIFHALPKASLWIVPDCGHNVFNERPQLAQRVVLEFLEKP
jgi:pimeloyl-ACP methyl ester carboxylesterase